MSADTTTNGEPVDHGEVVRPRRVRISWAWVFPILAATATAWLFWSSWRSNGPEVEITFDSAPGIEAGKTPLVYRGVVAGKVTNVRLDKELKNVVLSVRLKEFAAELAREGTVFWIDQPVIGLGKTSGLEALIQGNSLQARLGNGPPATHFTGADHVPLTPLESPALILKLRSKSIPFLDRGSPLFYRGISVGSVEDKALDEKGNPYLRVVVDKDFAKLVKSNARFWPVSATSVRIGPGGMRLDLFGLKAFLLGGLEFEVFGDPGDGVANGTEFALYANQSAARSTGEPVKISFRSAKGIQAGQTEIRHLGIAIGYVESTALNLEDQSVEATVRFQPAYEKLHNAGATFTLVEPRISLDGVTGLDTLVSGVYIDCVPGPGGAVATSFEGRTLSDDGMLTAQSERDGIQVTLHAKSLPPIGEGAPVLYRGLVAGRVEGTAIGPDGEPTLDAVVRRQFAAAVSRNARFWQVPATTIQAGPGVLNIDVAGLQTLVQGGVAFDVFGPPEGKAENGAKFELFASEPSARAISPPIKITFDNGQGLLAGQTQVRYLGLPVGLVEEVKPVKGRVEATVRLNSGYDFLRREGSAFSVVRLDVSLKGVTGLETVVSGIYIDCGPSEGGPLADNFRGVSLARAAFAEKVEQGLEVVLTARESNISVGAPVAYRGLTVGRVGRKILSSDGRNVGLCAVIDPPYNRLIRKNTEFWDAGGVKISLGFLSLKVQTASLDAIARGGIAFATPDDLGSTVKNGHEFELNKSPRREWLHWAPEIPSEK